ncbi:dTDP-4-dehydrorhamnose reductase [Paracoccus sp. 1_MG-2023]|uniref:dTDP-4-dehydrorhamnose reductase n=1 Tax=unclassified Paracoccus (in: a-proteobacteria) TaxID=2688777 RepID=UPI001C09DA87|nr:MULTISPECIES: dTDP-4-dehydrorhamnose reductase [unclassified Paracoccus (in: a-proteobacteria)]MBU2957258.1 dTDP-4-dehydrorhamnose reductase [Paracoccus sp. C2R09]MDO6669145.1 dTDP-4-dehydrorhamnose reductase [Paracoccus sp. 1_MG-2023]
MRGLLVFGRTGQLATELMSLAPDATFLGRDMADLNDPEGCARAIRDAAPCAVINAAAHTAVDRAEAERDAAHRINTEAPAAMARACAASGLPFLHVSTDYVFDGSGRTPRSEDAPTAPLGVYGATKLAGERAIADAGGQWAVMRTSWVFSAHGTNFVKTMLRLGAERDRLTIVDDQIGGPTPARDIAAAALAMIRAMLDDPAKGGLYHFAGAPDTSWAGFAREIFAQAGLTPEVSGIPTAEYPTPARRPLNSRLDCTRIGTDFGIPRPDWRKGLAEILKDLETGQ